MVATACLYVCTIPCRIFIYCILCCSCVLCNILTSPLRWVIELSIILSLIFIVLVSIIIPILATFCFTFLDYIYPIFSSFGIIYKPCGECASTLVNEIQFKTYPKGMRDLCSII